MKTLSKLFVQASLLLLASSVFAEVPAIKVLLITGHNNHDWKETTPLIVETLEHTERFEVEVTETFEAFDPENLEKFDVIFSNWNLAKKTKEMRAKLDWSPQLRKAYVDFVKNGKGHVALHAGSSTFGNWPEYQQIGVASWKKGTHHGPRHEFEVKIHEDEHPVTKGLSNFKQWDELWEKVYVSSEDAIVLTSSYASKRYKGDDMWEPSTFVSHFGKGRTAYTSFGHSARSFESKDVRVLLARLVEWAATGEVTIPAPEKL